MRRFVFIGQRAVASADFSLEDLAGTSGRLDVLLRALRAALMVSHGVRKDTVAYLVLLGGPRAPKTIRVDGGTVQFLRPEERSLATLVRKVLAAAPEEAPVFTLVRPGIAIVNAGLGAVLADLGGARPLVLEEGAPDVRTAAEIGAPDVAFFLGDHLGFEPQARAQLAAIGATPLGLGPVSVHVEDAVAIVSNELDRRAAPAA